MSEALLRRPADVVSGAQGAEVPVASHLTRESSRLLALDGLRGLAALGVVVFHGYPRIGFWMGSFVDLFFVISGFVITRMLISAPTGQHVSLKNFWMRRILRIWPVYFLTLGLGLAVLWTIAFMRAGFEVPPDWWKCLLFIQFTEWYAPREGAFVEVFLQYPLWLAHSWSLAVEEQFYLFWPLLLLLCRGWWGALALSVALAATCWYANIEGWPPVTLATRSLGLAFGAILALGEQRLKRVPPGHFAHHLVALLLGVVLCAGVIYEAPLVAGYYAGDRSWQYMGPPTVRAWDMIAFSLIYAGLVGLLIVYRGGILARVLSLRPLVYLGSVSYALYMLHFPLMAFFGRTGMGWPVLHHLGVVENLAYWLVLLALAHASRRWIERPFNDRKHDYPLYVTRAA